MSEISIRRQFGDLTAGTTIYTAAGRNELHHHENPTICYLIHGGGTERKGNRVYERFASDLRCYHAGEPHRSEISVFPSRCVNLEIEERFLNRNGISDDFGSIPSEDNHDLKFLMLKLHQELREDDSFSGGSVEMLASGILASRPGKRSRTPEWINRLRDLIHDRWNEQLSLSDLSAELGVHPTTISKHFTRYFACTYGEYVRRIRVERSLRLIKDSDLSLTDIAFECGFSDHSHFIRNFRRMTGFRPKDFRRI